jgi:hypothetical protein
VGNTATNSLAASATQLTAIDAVVAATATAARTATSLDGLTTGNATAKAQLSLLNEQYSTTAKPLDAISSTIANASISATVNPNATTATAVSTLTDATVSLDSNSVASTARANTATNAMTLDFASLSLTNAVRETTGGTNSAGGTNIAVLASTQANTIGVTSTIDVLGTGATDLVASITTGLGAVDSTSLSASSNALTSLASGNAVANTFALTGTTISTVDANDLAPTLAASAFTAAASTLSATNTAFAVANDQSNSGAITSSIGTGAGAGANLIQATLPGARTITDSVISADSNRAVAQSVAASDSTTTSTLDATSITTSFLTASRQLNTGAVSATVGDADSEFTIQASTGATGTVDQSSVTASSNVVGSTATALSDVARLTLGGTSTATLDGAGGIDNGDATATTAAAAAGLSADYGMVQSQTNSGAVTAATKSTTVDVTVGTLTDSSVAASSNLLTSIATAASGTAALTASAATIGATTAPVFALVSTQNSLTGAISSTLEDSAVTMTVANTGATTNSESLTMDSNTLSSVATAVSGTNALTTAADGVMGGLTDMANAGITNNGTATLSAEADRMLVSDQVNASSVTANVASTSDDTNGRIEMTVSAATNASTLSMSSNAIAGTAIGATGTNTLSSTAGASNAASAALLASQEGSGAISSTVTEPRLAVTLTGIVASSAVDMVSNSIAATATGLTETNRLAVTGGSIDPITGAGSFAVNFVTGTAAPTINVTGSFATLSSYQDQSGAVSAKVANDGTGTLTPATILLSVAGATTTDSALALTSNAIAATATAGTVTNVLSQVSDTSVDFSTESGGGSMVSVQNGTGAADVTSTIEGVNVNIAAVAVASSTLDVTGNTANATATGFSAYNTSTLTAGTVLTGDTDGGLVASTTDVMTIGELASVLANSQTNAGDVIALFDTSTANGVKPLMGITLTGAVTSDSAIDVSSNTMRAQATGVLAQNVSTITAGLMTDVSAAVANDQDASGAITATLGGPNFTITGTAADGTLSTDSNIAVASATSTSATNRLTLTSDTSIDGAGATAATTDTLTVATAGDFSSSDAITLLNRQTSSAAVGSSISGDADMGDTKIGTVLTGALTGSITADSNILVAQSRGNVADSAMSLTAGSSLSDDTQAVLASNQVRTGGAITAAQVGSTEGQIQITVGGAVTGSVSASDNTVRSTGTANVAINAMTVTGTSGIDLLSTAGAASTGSAAGVMTTNAQYAVMNGQSNGSAVTSTLTNFQIGITESAATGNSGSLALNGNMMMADATGNSASNSLRLYSDGSGTDASGSVSNFQTNTAAMSAVVTAAEIVASTGGASGSVSVANNSIAASAVGNTATSVISTAGSTFTSF